MRAGWPGGAHRCRRGFCAPQMHLRLMWSIMWIGLHIRTHMMKTIQMTIDDRLLKLVDKMSRAQKTSRSAFIRVALEAEIRRQRIGEEEARHLDGYARKPVKPGEFDVWNSEQDWGAK